MKKSLCLLGVCLFLVATLQAGQGTRLLHQPDVSADKIVFVYAGDLWTVPSAGGAASRLTTHPGSESSAKFSPDGKWIAFSAQYDGNNDVYVIPTTGGEPKRLTFHSGSDTVQDWTPDGKKILFSSSRYHQNRRSQLFTVSINGGFPDQLPIPRAALATYSPDGKQIVYTPINNAFNTWKRYRGGRTTMVWLINLSDWSHVEVPHGNFNDTYPECVGDTIYFLSDRNTDMGLFAYNIKDQSVKEMATQIGVDIKYLSSGAGKLVFSREGYIYLYDPGSKQTEQVVVEVNSDNIHVRPSYKNVGREIRSFDVSPSGKRALFEAHGEILTVPAKKGDIRNITQSTGVMERYPAWSPDGRHIAYFSDESGEYALHIKDQLDKKKTTKITLQNPTFFYNPTWSPDSKKIAFRDKKANIWLLNINSKKIVRVDEMSASPSWSGDSKWITYQKRLNNRFGVIWVYSLETSSRHRITDGMSDAAGPIFDAEGKYLFFRASTNSGMSKSGLDMSSNDHPVTYNIYIAVLGKEQSSPFQPESDEESVKPDAPLKQAKAKGKSAATRKDAPAVFAIDLKNIDQRIIALPVGSGSFSQLASVKGGKLFYRSGASIMQYDFKARKADILMTGVSAFKISADGKMILYRAGRNWGLTGLSGKPKPGQGRLNLSSFEVYVEPRAEWAQMLREAWRLNRDYFYAPNMHGVDWKANLLRYEKYLDDLAHRSDLNYVLGEMLGELCVGHSYIRGGAFPAVDRVPGGLLGADFAIDAGHYKFKKIYFGLNWNPTLRAPLTEPGVNVESGDYLLRVNGRKLDAGSNVYELFENTSGKQVELTVNSQPTEKGARTVTVVPISNEYSLRNRAWIEGNRAKVAKMTNGKIGYVYLPNTGRGGYSYFNRYFFPQLDMEGLVIDERYNGGGQVANYIVEYLGKKLLNYWAPREGPDYSSPFAASFGPKVMIVNEYAGSGGDWMPFYFRESGVGKLVGKRTWGGLVGIGGTPGLMDGGSVTSPNFGIFSKDGKWIIENEGVWPDYEVEMTPKDVIAGRDPQLEKAVQVVLEELKTKKYSKTKRPAYPIRKR